MKKFAIKVLLAALNLFSNSIVSAIGSEWVKRSVALTIKRLTLFGEALTDADPNDKVQIERIARETLLSPEFQDLEKEVTAELAAKIPNEHLANLLIQSDALRLQLFAAIGDDNTDNGEQLKAIFEGFIKTEEFDSIVIGLAQLLADKYSKNEVAKQFIVSLVTSLVNSDDND
jgi:hypothetical protein